MSGAEDYDELVAFASRPPETDAEVAGLAELAGGGRVLELGVGTGRVAIPLAATGLETHGIELDPEMIRLLQAKPGGGRVVVHRGDMTDVAVDGQFALVYAVFGTFFSLMTQAGQVACFGNVAARLAQGGRLVIEALMPQPASYDRLRKVSVVEATDGLIILNISHTDPLAQTIDTRQLLIARDGITINPIHVRYSWPSELDLMAQLAGMHLEARWSEWDGTPFTSTDPRHISIFALDGA